MRSVKEMKYGELVISKSRFIAFLIPVKDEQEVQSELSKIRKTEPGASHYCYAYVMGPHGEMQKASDDGEPQKTAGIPILEVLKKQELTNVIAIVVRYFGGILLGSGGLIRAYSKAVSQLLPHLEFTTLQHMLLCEMICDYATFAEVEHVLKDKVGIRQTTFLDKVTLEFVIHSEQYLDIEKSMSGFLRSLNPIHILEEFTVYE